ncbi:Serpin domain containing protein [Asbolus verrucosus]|uniref:Serpin domain containing protein n=1 Tax=Asbolus verrucosus TaxID=1661398 RepID=A0A482VTQ5_ASBVE|nr:Serpin domain containing protein [Asbolus verrucosus]
MDFYKTNNNVVKVDTMHHYEEEFNYCGNPDLNAKFLGLLFEEKVLERQNFTNEYVKICLNLKSRSALELKKELKNQDDLSGIAGNISDVVQKTYTSFFNKKEV